MSSQLWSLVTLETFLQQETRAAEWLFSSGNKRSVMYNPRTKWDHPALLTSLVRKGAQLFSQCLISFDSTISHLPFSIFFQKLSRGEREDLCFHSRTYSPQVPVKPPVPSSVGRAESPFPAPSCHRWRPDQVKGVGSWGSDLSALIPEQMKPLHRPWRCWPPAPGSAGWCRHSECPAALAAPSRAGASEHGPWRSHR